MRKESRKHEPLVSEEELALRRYKNLVSTEPATSSEGTPEIPARPKGAPRATGNSKPPKS
jgi:hypothetical protein